MALYAVWEAAAATATATATALGITVTSDMNASAVQTSIASCHVSLKQERYSSMEMLTSLFGNLVEWLTTKIEQQFKEQKAVMTTNI